MFQAGTRRSSCGRQSTREAAEWSSEAKSPFPRVRVHARRQARLVRRVAVLCTGSPDSYSGGPRTPSSAIQAASRTAGGSTLARGLPGCQSLARAGVVVQLVPGALCRRACRHNIRRSSGRAIESFRLKQPVVFGVAMMRETKGTRSSVLASLSQPMLCE